MKNECGSWCSFFTQFFILLMVFCDRAGFYFHTFLLGGWRRWWRWSSEKFLAVFPIIMMEFTALRSRNSGRSVDAYNGDANQLCRMTQAVLLLLLSTICQIDNNCMLINIIIEWYFEVAPIRDSVRDTNLVYSVPSSCGIFKSLIFFITLLHMTCA